MNYPQPVGGAYPPTIGQAWQPGDVDIHEWDDLPQKPLDDNPNAEPPAYRPPPTADFQQYQGYESCGGFGQFTLLPAPPQLPPPTGAPPPMEFDSVANLSEDECRQAMLDFVAKNCCYGKKAAKQMDISDIQPTTALHYILETFCESRSTGYDQEPYRGGAVDGPENGPPPGPWDIYCQPDVNFDDHKKKFEVPHTSTIKPCFHCHARGFLRCHRCHGLGWVRCVTCHGDGRVTRVNPEGHHEHHSCSMCGGDGRRRCSCCAGDGRIICQTCRGYRYLRCFILLTVQYINHKDDHIIERTDMPDELVRDVSGVTIFEQVLPQLWPVVGFHVQEININSQRLVEQHYQSFTNERKITQRQQLRAVPVTEVHYKWNDARMRYWVYGQQREVHCPDYPQQCCWGCAIL